MFQNKADQSLQMIYPKHYSSFKPGEEWYDKNEKIINAHGGGMLYYNNTYYWFGETRGKSASEGVSVYSSKDLYNWENKGLALKHETDSSSDITIGSIIERPKVIYNEKTKQFVMWFHLELKGKGYSAARAGVAVSKSPVGPYKFIKSFRPNGNMSRDMTLYKDGNGNAYEIYSSRDNYDMRIVELTPDYLSPTTKDSLIASDHREAPAIFKYNQKYYLITSASTGWAPNEANLYVSKSLFGKWQDIGNPMVGKNANITFYAQSACIFPVAGKKNAFIYMADKWDPRDLKDSRYIWLPVQFKNGKTFIEWKDEWDLHVFDN
ncbi:MAG TPA: glycoside hydrolase family 43 protein [Hanamia sp.]|nr:glycoside hydrolase family 43 protein [Hanamia sp.]